MENSETTEKRKRGRPAGSNTLATRRARELAQKTGKLPHEILLSIARGEPQEIKVPQEDGTTKTKLVAVDSLEAIKSAASAAAPYFAARISSVELINGVSDDDLNEFIKSAASEAGFSLGDGGSSEAEEDEDSSSHSSAHVGARRNDFT